MIDERWQAVRNVLLVRLDNLGDVLLTTPAFHAVKTSLPDVSLTLLASPIGAQVAALNPDIQETIVYSAPWMDPWHKLLQDSVREQQMIAQIRERHFDGAIIFTSFRQSPLPAAYTCYLADIPLRVAASIDGPGSLLTTRHKHPERMMHEVERGLDLVGAIGMHTDDRSLVLKVPDETMRKVRQMLAGEELKSRRGGSEGVERAGTLAVTHPVSRRGGSGRVEEVGTLAVAQPREIISKSGMFLQPGRPQGSLPHSPTTPAPTGKRGPFVVVHPGCTMPARTYPWEMYVEVIDLLVEQLGAFVVVTGAVDERPLVAQVLEHVRPANREHTQGMAGVLSFPELCALIKLADMTITNNTGPMHISAAVKTPVIALFALTNPPEQWGPWQVLHRQMYHDVSCRICYSRVCPYQHECLRLVSPSMVVSAAAELLSEVSL